MTYLERGMNKRGRWRCSNPIYVPSTLQCSELMELMNVSYSILPFLAFQIQYDSVFQHFRRSFLIHKTLSQTLTDVEEIVGRLFPHFSWRADSLDSNPLHLSSFIFFIISFGIFFLYCTLLKCMEFSICELIFNHTPSLYRSSYS